MEEKKTTIAFPTKKDPVFGWYVKSGTAIGEDSKFGDVFQVCKEKDCDYVIKIILGTSHKKIKKEVKLQKKCEKNGICKPVEDWWLFKGKRSVHLENLFLLEDSVFPQSGGVIITPILDETFGRKVEKEKDEKKRREYLKDSWRVLLKLHQINIIHNDAHYNNLMFDKKGNLFMIDMGKAVEVSPKKQPLVYYEGIMKDYESVPHNIPSLKKYYDVVLDILKERMLSYVSQESLSIQETEKRSVEEILDMKDIDLDILVGEHLRDRSGTCTIL